MPSIRDRGYLCPEPFYKQGGEWKPSDEADLLDWAKSVITDGRSYLRLQPAYQYIQSGMDLINGEKQRTTIQSLSDVTTESTVRNTKELVAAQTNIRIIPAFKCEIDEFRKQTTILNNGFMSWQGMTFADRRIREAWQYAEVAGTGYTGLRYDPNFYYKGKGDNVLDSYGPMDVLPIGMGRDHKLQKAYAVAIRKEMPIHEVWRMFPLAQDLIVPSRHSVLGKGTVISQAVKFASAVVKRFGQGSNKHERETTTWDTVDVYHIYVDDDSVNETGREIEMRGPDGQYGTKWSYKVPYVGMRKPDRVVNGEMRFKEAAREDCLLYPNRRLIIATDYCIVNPEPECQASYYWHAKVPINQYRCDDWAWNFLGFPITRYGQSLEKAGIELWRGMMDMMNGRLNPTTSYVPDTQANSMLQTLNLRIPGQRVAIAGGSLTPPEHQLRPFLPVQWYEFPAHYLAAASQMLPAMIKEQMGVADSAALARARQLPSGDSTEKILEALGPLVKDQSRNMEESIRDMGEMWKSNFFQFITAKRRMQLMGPDGLAEEDWDYDPGELIPMSLNPEETWMQQHVPLAVPQFERARWHKDNFTFSVTPYSLHEMNSMTRKLFYLQLQKAGVPIDPWTLSEIFDLKNFGALPKYSDPDTGDERTANTILERWVCWEEMKARMSQAIGGGQQPGGKGRGRPGSGQQPPTMEQKQGGTASTVRESKH